MRILAAAAGGFAAGCGAYCLGLSGRLCLLFGCAFLLMGAAGLLLRRRRALYFAALLLLGLGAGLLHCRVYETRVMEPARARDGREGTVLAYAADFPEETGYGWQLRVREAESGTLLAVYGDICPVPEAAPGDLLELTGVFRLADTLGGEKTLSYYADGLRLRLDVTRPPEQTGEARPGLYAMVYVSEGVKALLQETVPEQARGFLAAMLTGDRTLLWEDEALTGAFEVIGISHVFAVSGMHVSVLAGFVLLLFGRRRWSAVLAALLSLGFAVMTGFSASVTRAFVMQFFVLLAPVAGRENDAPTSLFAALLLLLLPNPHALASLGLQLSFLATAGLVWLAPHLNRRLTEPLEKKQVRKRMSRLLRVCLCFLAASFSATAAALVMTAPLSASAFRTASLISPAANLLFVPAAEAAFCCGAASAALGAVWLPAGKLFGAAAGFFAEYVRRGALLFARFPLASVYTNMSIVFFWLLFASAVFLLVRVKNGTLRSYGRAAAAVTVTLCAVLLCTAGENAAEPLSVAVLDVGQGQCVAAVSAGGTLVADCGGDALENAGDTAADYLHSRGARRVSVLVLTHYHDDHANGVEQLFARMPVDAVVLPEPAEEDVPRAEAILRLAKEQESAVLWIREVTRISFGSAEAVIYPPLGVLDENERCMALTVSAEGFDAVITGDLPGTLERELANRYALPDAELLVVGHHGAKASACQALLEAVKPEAAAISVGINAYGQPAPELLLRLQEAGIAVYRTDEDGTVTFRMR